MTGDVVSGFGGCANFLYKNVLVDDFLSELNELDHDLNDKREKFDGWRS